MSSSIDVRSKVLQAIKQRGASAVARELNVSRSAILGYAGGVSREPFRLIIEQRADRLVGVSS